MIVHVCEVWDGSYAGEIKAEQRERKQGKQRNQLIIKNISSGEKAERERWRKRIHESKGNKKE